MATLTPDAISKLNNGDVELHPILQVMDIRQIGNMQSTQERYRLVLSDGTYVQQAMLATQLNEFVKNFTVQKNSIVQLKEYICNTVQSRKIIIVLNMDVVQTHADLIGDPKLPFSGSEQQPPGASAPPSNPRQPHEVPPAMPAHPQQSPYAGTGNDGVRQGGPGPHAVNGNYSKNENGVHNLQRVTNTAHSPGNGIHQGHGQFVTNSNGVGGTDGGGFAQQHQGQRQFVTNSNGGGGTAGGGYAQQHTYGQPPLAYEAPPPPPRYSVRGPIARNEAPARIVPIAALNPYQGRWTIKARVTAKGELRRYHNARGDGKVFSFDLLDAEAGEIRCTCFNATADQFYEKLEVGSVYLVTKGSLKPAQKQFNHLKNEWEITLETASTVELVMDEDNSIPRQVFDFKPIGEIENMENNAMVDIVGIVLSIQDSVQIMRKNGTEALKRTLIMTDKSGRSVELTLWGQFCNKEGDEIQQLIHSGRSPVLAIKAARVSDFSGKSVGTLNTSQIIINADIPEAHMLRAWHDREGRNLVVQSISREAGPGGRSETRKTVAQIKDEGLGRNEKPDWISVRATVSFIKADNFCYTACPNRVNDKQCSKKVTNNGDGTWHCERCDQSVPECDYRYLLQMQVQDHTGVTWISGFQEAGEEIFGVPAKDLFMWKQAENPRFADTVQKVLFSTHLFKLKVKEETFQDEARVKCTVIKSENVNFASESKLLLDCIKQGERGETKPTVAYTPASTTAGYPPASTGISYGGGASHWGPNYSSSYGANAHGMNGSYGGVNGSVYNPGGSTSDACYKCGQVGHFANSCPNRPADRNEFGGGRGGTAAGGQCYKCGQGGHYAKDCPNQGGGRSFGSGGGDGAFGGSSGYGRRGF